jgi:hypothetical protein
VLELYFWYSPTFLTPNIHQTGPFAVETCDWTSPSWMCILSRKWLLTPTCIHVRIYICMRVYFICFSHAYDIHTHSLILICMHAWMYGSMNLWIYASKYLHIYICVYICIHTHVCVSIYLYMYPCMYPCMNPCMYPCNIYRHVCMYIYFIMRLICA